MAPCDNRSVIITIVQVIGALALLYGGGEMLVGGASVLARRVGISALAVGLTVVAFGTSMPELVVSLDAALAGASDISIGNVVGSNIANVALILGLSSLIRPMAVEAKLVHVDAPLMVGVSLVLVGVLLNGDASRFEGSLLAVGLVAYILFTLWEARRESEIVRQELASAAPKAEAGAAVSTLGIVLGLGLLVAGGHLLVSAAIEMAQSLGVSQAAIGLTVVAVGTSIPELATSLVAALRRRGDIGVGNVVGSNIFNILGILGVTALVHPLPMGDVTWFDLGTMVVLAGAVTTVLLVRHRVGRVEGIVLLASFIAYTFHRLAG